MLALPYYENFSRGRLVVLTKHAKQKTKVKEVVPCPKCREPMLEIGERRYNCYECRVGFIMLQVGFSP